MKTEIRLADMVLLKTEAVEAFEGSENELIARLTELQAGYCEDEKPFIEKSEVSSGVVIVAQSNSDFSYIAKISK